VFKGCSYSIIRKKQGTHPIFWDVRVVESELVNSFFSHPKQGENSIQIIVFENPMYIFVKKQGVRDISGMRKVIIVKVIPVNM